MAVPISGGFSSIRQCHWQFLFPFPVKFAPLAPPTPRMPAVAIRRKPFQVLDTLGISIPGHSSRRTLRGLTVQPPPRTDFPSLPSGEARPRGASVVTNGFAGKINARPPGARGSAGHSIHHCPLRPVAPRHGVHVLSGHFLLAPRGLAFVSSPGQGLRSERNPIVRDGAQLGVPEVWNGGWKADKPRSKESSSTGLPRTPHPRLGLRGVCLPGVFQAGALCNPFLDGLCDLRVGSPGNPLYRTPHHVITIVSLPSVSCPGGQGTAPTCHSRRPSTPLLPTDS